VVLTASFDGGFFFIDQSQLLAFAVWISLDTPAQRTKTVKIVTFLSSIGLHNSLITLTLQQ
jgi:hypothetical protein